MIVLKMLLALALDALWGEPRRWHPLVGFGCLISRVEAWLRREHHSAHTQWLAGGFGWLLLAGVPTLLLKWLLGAFSGWVLVGAQVLVLYLAIGNRSLAEHARAVTLPLLTGHLAAARNQVARIVSRNTAVLDEEGVARAAVESVLENGSDAVLAPLFWFAVAGAPGAMLYRLANTLDARWGYRSERYLHFGRVAARLDDVLNWIPARLCALSYGLGGHLSAALRCWRAQAPKAASPNAGPVMAAGAGALGIRLGGSVRYQGEEEWRPVLGCGRPPQLGDIQRAVYLLWRAIAFWLVAITLIEISLGFSRTLAPELEPKPEEVWEVRHHAKQFEPGVASSGPVLMPLKRVAQSDRISPLLARPAGNGVDLSKEHGCRSWETMRWL